MSTSRGYLITGTDTGKLRALDAQDGAMRWERQIGHPFAGPALALVGNNIIAASLDGRLYALHASDGAVIWETALPGIDWLSEENSIRVVPSASCIALQFGAYLMTVDPADGVLLWQHTEVLDSLTQGRWLLGIGTSHLYLVVKQARRRLSSSDSPPHLPSHALPHVWTTSALDIRTGTTQWATTEYITVPPHGMPVRRWSR